MDLSETYRIFYHHPETGEALTVIKTFEGAAGITAREWAEDYAYMIADKGRFQLERVS